MEELEKLASKILEDARQKGEAIVSDGKREAKAIEDEAKGTAKFIELKILQEARIKADHEKKRVVSDAIIQARKRRLNAREELIAETFERAEKKLEEIVASQAYGEILAGLIEEACAEIGGGELVLLLREEDKALASKRLNDISKSLKHRGLDAKLTIGSDGAASPGAVVQSKGGEMKVSNLLKTLFERMKPALRLQTAKILFG